MIKKIKLERINEILSISLLIILVSLALSESIYAEKRSRMIRYVDVLDQEVYDQINASGHKILNDTLIKLLTAQIPNTTIIFLELNTTQDKCGHDAIGCYYKPNKYYQHPSRIYAYCGQGSIKCQELMIHEIGHGIWYEIMNSNEREYWEEITNYDCYEPVTDYAATCIEEDFAENFEAFYSPGYGWKRSYKSYNGKYNWARIAPHKINYLRTLAQKYNLPKGLDYEQDVSCNSEGQE